MCDHSEFAVPLKSSIWRASQTNQLYRIKELIEKDIQNVNSKDEYGYTALHYASRSGNISIVKYLLSKNASVNVSNSGGDSPLHRSSFMGHYDICKLLLDKKANPNYINSDNQTPLHRAFIVELLLENNANPSIKDKHGNTYDNLFN